jgi:DNA-binding NarL/FixJ family response regulator
VIVDDHPIVREGLVERISRHPDLAVCGEAENAREALAIAAAEAPDLMIVDLNLPGPGGLELIKDIQAMRPELPVLVLSMHDESLYAERALRAGARGYISKQAGGQKLIEAIRRVLSGHVYLSESVADTILGSFTPRQKRMPPSPMALLTDRELEVFKLIGLAKRTRTISRELHMSVKTVEAHRASIKRKLKLKTGPELTRRAVLWVEKQE